MQLSEWAVLGNLQLHCPTGHVWLCAWRAGYIRLWLPVFHIGYLKSTLVTLQCICKACSRVLLPPDERTRFLRMFRRAPLPQPY